MASVNDIKKRRNTILSTQQITKAMKLVSTVKLQNAKIKAEEIHPYFSELYNTINSLLSRTKNIIHPFLELDTEGKTAVLVISSNRGLAGGYNSNIAKIVLKGGIDKDNSVIYSLGHKASDILLGKSYEVDYKFNDYIDNPSVDNARKICEYLISEYNNKKINRIILVYTEFKNTLVHIPHLIKLLPFDRTINTKLNISSDVKEILPLSYEIDEAEALEILIPNYITSIIYSAMIEAIASENGARMQAMDSATTNAEDLINSLTLMYNRVRQSNITQEITEIIAGSEAI